MTVETMRDLILIAKEVELYVARNNVSLIVFTDSTVGGRWNDPVHKSSHFVHLQPCAPVLQPKRLRLTCAL